MQLWQRNRGTSALKNTERSSKWSAVFSIRTLCRVEADETLPESVLQEIRGGRATKARLARDSLRPATACDANICGIQPEEYEAYNHSSLPSRKQIPASYRRQLPQSSSSSRVRYGEKQIAIPKSLPPVSKPPPPRENYLTSGRKPTLSTILEATNEPILSPGHAIDSGYIFLPAAPFTLTIPTFRHGPIRLNKADVLAGKSPAAFDDTLDWTAFQMAIIGGVGDCFDESTDYSKPSNAGFNEQDDIMDWFVGFGFEGPGTLISAADVNQIQKPETPPATPKISDGGDGQESIKGFQNSTQQPNLTWQCDEFSNGQKSGGVDASHKRASVSSIQSLPQSPMLDLVLSHDVDGNEYTVSMGFNLGHDLEDFLKWEAEHVFGGYHDRDQVL
ncbi:hypothetical protein B0T14DRAFT_511930 [Immersiella caudata]|uniref:Uncharacterized protein n=1 Tax=Immersiella caudata TaxID=314043 RepID=A0AA39X5I0_9PEZI|nr:hypothetical protein B0T14DRAFT_511930 [Immersiella caudata]